MSEIIVVWAADRNLAAAKAAELRAGREATSRILRRGDFSLAQAEDAATGEGIDSGAGAYVFVIEAW